MTGVVEAIDYKARSEAQKALDEIEGHERLCAERYKNINDTLGDLKGLFKWAGGTLFTVLIGTLGWLTVEKLNGDDTAVLQAKVEILQQQAAAR